MGGRRRFVEHESPSGLVPVQGDRAAVPPDATGDEEDRRERQADGAHARVQLRRLQRVLLDAGLPQVWLPREPGGRADAGEELAAAGATAAGEVHRLDRRLDLQDLWPRHLAGRAGLAARDLELASHQAVRGAPFVAAPPPLVLADLRVPPVRAARDGLPRCVHHAHRRRHQRHAVAGAVRRLHHTLDSRCAARACGPVQRLGLAAHSP
mmetsp:Transcript_15487/g.36624  ORF Transcript_15487/g.36624 Transcript_15487/m.36624 type:complete len:209 (-) Transcript_15487:229-855(-)